ncbi:hypothetical protein [Gordonia sp. NPDC003376]
MPSSTKRRLVSATAFAAIGVAVALGTTGCGAGQISQTANQLPAVNGGSATAPWGQLEIRNAQVLYPSDNADEVFDNGGPFQLTFVVANSSQTTTYKLTKVTVAQGGQGTVTLSGTPTIDPLEAIRAGTPANSVISPSSTTASAGSTSATESATASASESASPASGVVSDPALGESAITAELNGTGKTVAAGLTTTLSFSFQKQENGQWVDAGTIDVQTPVDGTPLVERRDVTRGGDAESEGGHH